ncbi:DUF5995 family protein [Williamsia sterculiae]|uniref:Uncharacterized protein n=1 Tax=Williamsia sterculiae TaxID=1344003 RepID=A0A1N7CMZ7_9NOCA|nr:DUF5995 family protein [Williamsia sterculiae]SIR64933.1 hypothetical protein SAMN05445060_0241 [Williamsia sterculiae]
MGTIRATALVVAGAIAVWAAGMDATVSAQSAGHGCGSALTSRERQDIMALSDPPTSTGSTLSRLRDQVSRLQNIADILVRHNDRRGLFAVGLAVTEREAVLPLESRPSGLQHPERAQAISLALLDRYLEAVHAEFGDGLVPTHWRRHFLLAADCTQSGQRVAMSGYNAHITTDLAYAVADSAATRSDAHDFYLIVDTIAMHAKSIVAVTNRGYGVDLGPAMRFYFVGEGLDRVVGAGRATGPMLRAADIGYNVLTFENGLALQVLSTRAAAVRSVGLLWSTGDNALAVAAALGVLKLR